MPRALENLKAGGHFLHSYANFKFLNKPRPMSAVFVVCNRCNLTCRYCNSPFLTEKELSLPDIEKLFLNLKSMGVYRLGLTGGEPLLRDDLAQTIDLAVGLRFYVSLNSNLLLYHTKPEVFSKVRFVFTSLDGQAAEHEQNRGKGSFAGVLEAIADLRLRRIPVIAIAVVDEDRKLAIERLAEYAAQFDFKIHFQVKGTSAFKKSTDIIRGHFSENFAADAYRILWKRILVLKKTTNVVASSREYIESVINWQDYNELRALRPKSKCAAGYGYLYISSSGLGYPCSLIKKSQPGIDLLQNSWNGTYDGKKPCNDCICGPYLQLNLLYTKPVSSLLDLYGGYGAMD